AERELIKVKLLTYMSHRIGDEFDAVITGVQDWGFFCQAVEIPAEGLVHVSTLDDDNYRYDPAAHLLEGRRAGRQYRMGASVRVVVAHVDVDRRQLDFRLAGTRSARSINQRGAGGSKQVVSKSGMRPRASQGKPAAGAPAAPTESRLPHNRNKPSKSRRRRRR
ncbi:MAG TPA: S1 RNA-binding domain-containing protein, partial [Planctomycetaceae bacterium]